MMLPGQSSVTCTAINPGSTLKTGVNCEHSISEFKHNGNKTSTYIGGICCCSRKVHETDHLLFGDVPVNSAKSSTELAIF